MIGNFMYGDEGALDQDWPTYGSASGNTFLNITAGGFEVEQMDETQLRRCEFLNSVFVNAENGI